MMICLSHASGTKLCISHHLILCIRKDKETNLRTWIMTGIQGSQGPVPFEIEESVEEVGLLINQAHVLESKIETFDPATLGFKMSGLASAN